MIIPLGDRINVYKTKTEIILEFNGIKYEVDWTPYNKEFLTTIDSIFYCFVCQVLYFSGCVERNNLLKYGEYVYEKLTSIVSWG